MAVEKSGDLTGPGEETASNTEPSNSRLLPTSLSAASLWTAIKKRPVFTTASADLDGIIARSVGRANARLAKEEHADVINGLEAGRVVEMSGPPGIGKTTICLSMAVEARLRLDEDIGVLIIDTEGSVMASQLIHLLETTLMARNGQSKSSLANAIQKAQDGIYLARPTCLASFLALMHQLEQWLQTHPNVQLVLIDTISYHFRHPVQKSRKDETKARTHSVTGRKTSSANTAERPDSPSFPSLAKRRKEGLNPQEVRDYHLKFVSGLLRSLASLRDPNLAVLCTSQLATRFYTPEPDRSEPIVNGHRTLSREKSPQGAAICGDSKALLQPQLGRVWSEQLDGRILTWFDHDGSRQVGINHSGAEWSTRQWTLPKR